MSGKPKEILYKDEMRGRLIEGAKKIYDAVRITMGSKGRNVIFERENAYPLILNDGVRIAREVVPKDKFEELAARLVLQASEKTNRVAGDGTSLTVVLTYAILSEGLKKIANGTNPMSLRKQLNEASKELIEVLQKSAEEIKDNKRVKEIATISSQSEEIGEAIAQIIKEVGKDAPITVEQGNKVGISHKIVKGMQFDKGMITPYFYTNPAKLRFEAEGCHIAVINERLCTFADVAHILEQLANGCEATNRPRNLLIIVEDMELEALSTALDNKIKRGFGVCCVQCPNFGSQRVELMRDIAILTGAEFIGQESALNMDKFEYSHFGYAERVHSDNFTTTIIGGAGPKKAVEDRIAEINAIKEQTSDDFVIEKMQERIGKLRGGVGVLQALFKTDSENEDLMLRIEDAVLATKSALAEGVVPGGGRTLHFLGSLLQRKSVGHQVIIEATKYPIRQIIENAGGNPDLVTGKLIDEKRKINIGYNSDTEEITDLLKDGVIDPVKVIREAMENAVSIASMILTTECAMVTEKEWKQPTK